MKGTQMLSKSVIITLDAKSDVINVQFGNWVLCINHSHNSVY